MPESSLERALELLRGAHARLVSVTPVRMTLEQYFMEQLGSLTPAQKQAGKAFAAAGATQ
jgi:hypothetical protein